MAKTIHIHVGARRKAQDAASPAIGAKVFLSHVPGGGTGVRGEVVRIENGWVFVRNDEGRTFKAPLDRVTQDSALGDPIYAPTLNRTMKELSNAEALLRLFKDRPDSPAKAHLTTKVKFLREELAKAQARALVETQDAARLIARNSGPDTWRVFEEGKPVSVAGPFKTAEEARQWIKKSDATQDAQARWYLTNSLGSNVTGHTSKPSFPSKQEAEAYKKTFKHTPAIATAKVVYGSSDQYGFITPTNNS